MKHPPRILCIGGHDPTGGAGIQADIETVTALGGQAFTLVTALTAQDTRNIMAIHPTPSGQFEAIAAALLRDIRPDAIKIGLIGAAALVPVLRHLLEDFPGPVVLDPVLAAGGGFDTGGDDLITAVRNHLMPLTTLVTPNRAEARRLTGLPDPQRAAAALLGLGCGAVLLTGADEAEGEQVINLLFGASAEVRSFSWPRLPDPFHGSGCTLASACATRLALGDDMAGAATRAQSFTWRALEHAVRAGGGQRLPWRRS